MEELQTPPYDDEGWYDMMYLSSIFRKSRCSLDKYRRRKDKTIKEIEFDKLYTEIIMDEPYFVTFLNEKNIAIYSNEKLVIFDIEKWNIKDVIYMIYQKI